MTMRDLIRAERDPSHPLHEQAVREGATFSAAFAQGLQFPVPSTRTVESLGLENMPDVVAARRLGETNELLAEMVDVARADAARARDDAEQSKRQTRLALLAAWVAVAVTVVVGVVQVWVAVTVH